MLTRNSSAGLGEACWVGQSYNGAATRSGDCGGVQAIIKEQYPAAMYLHSTAHCLNLTLVNIQWSYQSCKPSPWFQVLSLSSVAQLSLRMLFAPHTNDYAQFRQNSYSQAPWYKRGWAPWSCLEVPPASASRWSGIWRHRQLAWRKLCFRLQRVPCWNITIRVYNGIDEHKTCVSCFKTTGVTLQRPALEPSPS